MAVTANQIIRRRGGSETPRRLPVAASTILYEGTLCFEDAGGDFTGTALENGAFGGIVVDKVDNSSGADGDKMVEVWVDGEVLLTLSAASAAKVDVGKTVAGVDNYQISETITDLPLVGIITEFVSTTQVWVSIKGIGEGDTGELAT